MNAGRAVDRWNCRVCGTLVVLTKERRETGHRCPHYQYCEGPAMPASCCVDLAAAQAAEPAHPEYHVVWSGAIYRKSGIQPSQMRR